MSPKELGMDTSTQCSQLDEGVNIISILGMGSFCTVFRGIKSNEENESFVAIKMPKFITCTNPKYAKELLWNEYNVLNLLNKEELNVPDKKKWPTFAYIYSF